MSVALLPPPLRHTPPFPVSGSTANISLTTYASCGSWRVFTTPTGIAAGRNLLFTAVLCFIPANRAFGFVPWF